MVYVPSTVLFNDHMWLRPSTLGSIQVTVVLKHACFSNCHHLPLIRTYKYSARSPIAGHVPRVYGCSLLCTHQIDMTPHTPPLTNRGALGPHACSYHSSGSRIQITYWQPLSLAGQSTIQVLTRSMVA